ncbi:energy-coupling factor transporter transmembrane component T family protein [Microbacterium paraoxydans]|uniref:Energy-coupling factor transporter transmembrane protein EcfT n=1 Tax=Microbacterium paraoxydans TaxID=199592 RepID=A0ABS5IPU0_9MICO|nr:energy-coupling factor transporter transmembrane protein EcfT [Microbacterium paraoxydans]MBS0024741.1 energy-coupling factor transporter transmembrane protein EcfT [Microbacterium paraoxydans]
MISLYRQGDSLVHRLPAGAKLAGLALCALVLTLLPPHPLVVAGALGATVVLFPLGGQSLRTLVRELWRLRWLLLVLGVMLALFVSPLAAWIGAGRVAALLLLAALVTMTTRMSDLLAVLQALLRPLRRFSVEPEAVALTLSLTLTMVPVVAAFANRLREAERARGVRLGPRAAVPLLVLTLRHADRVGDALAARGVA